MIKRDIIFQKKSPVIRGQRIPYIPESIYDDLIKDLKVLLDNWNYEAKYWNARAELCTGKGVVEKRHLEVSSVYKKCIKQLKEKLKEGGLKCHQE
jgi:hypothetical protein